MKIGNVLLIVLFFVSFAVSSQNIERILSKHFEAHTQEFWNQVRTVTVEGAWFEGSDRTLFTLHAKRPNKIILKGTWDDKPYAEAYDGTVGWTLAPWTNVSKPQLMLSHEQLMITHFFDYGSPIPGDQQLQYKGKVKEDGLECHWLVEVHADVEYDYFVDVHKFLLRKVNRRESIGDQTELLTKTYDIYKQFGGVTFPTLIWVKTKKAEREFIFDNLVVGDGVSDAVFRQPIE